MTLAIVVAASDNDMIGHRNSLPWHLPEDLARFRKITHGRAVIVGRSTNDSIVNRLGGALPDRYTVLLSRSKPAAIAGDGAVARTPEEAVYLADQFRRRNGQDEAFVIGGLSVYQQLMPLIEQIYMTRVHRIVDGDTLLSPGWLDGFSLDAQDDTRTSRTGLCYTFSRYSRA
ncbi:MAG: dihydrofolate reductase [Streptosporangiaceae bacterium]